MHDDDADNFERYRPKRDRRPTGRTRARSHRDANVEDSTTDPGLAFLMEQGTVGEIVAEIKSGKEADVLLARGKNGPVALKAYRDRSAGGARPDPRFLEGRQMPRGRLRKVLDRGARMGLDADLALWVLHEATTLWRLHGGGVPVPQPLVGPAAYEIASAGRFLPMAFVGEDDGTPAPRLAEVAMDPSACRAAWAQIEQLVERLLRLGIVHGDLSAWNLLWHDGRVVLIDVPQAVDVTKAGHAHEIFERDVENLVSSVSTWNLDLDPARVAMTLRTRAGKPATGPLDR